MRIKNKFIIKYQQLGYALAISLLLSGLYFITNYEEIFGFVHNMARYGLATIFFAVIIFTSSCVFFMINNNVKNNKKED